MSGILFYVIIRRNQNKGSNMKHTMIVLMGGQGVGKGTFARMLMEQGKYRYVEAGAILRSAPADSEIAKTISRGELVTDELLFDIIGKAIDADLNGDMIVDGFPRTMGQAKWLVETYADKFNVHVLYLDVPETIMVERIEKRIREGGGRADDADSAAVRRRLDNFWKTTVPAIEWLRTVSNIKFSDLDVCAPDVTTNFEKVKKALA